MHSLINDNNHVINDLKTAIQNNQPWCLIRFGDNEICLIDPNEISNSVLNKIFKASFSNIQTFSLARKLELKSEISALLIDCAKNTTWLGVHPDWNLCTRLGWQNTASVITSIGIPNYEKKLCSMNLHYYFNSLEKLDILFNRKELTIITCRDVKDKLKKYFNISTINQHLIDGEEPFRENASSTNEHYSKQFPKLLTLIKSESRIGQLLLVGAGYLGKCYCVEWMRMGGIAVDIGSVFDNWAGYVTRGKGKGCGVRKPPLLV